MATGGTPVRNDSANDESALLDEGVSPEYTFNNGARWGRQAAQQPVLDQGNRGRSRTPSHDSYAQSPQAGGAHVAEGYGNNSMLGGTGDSNVGGANYTETGSPTSSVLMDAVQRHPSRAAALYQQRSRHSYRERDGGESPYSPHGGAPVSGQQTSDITGRTGRAGDATVTLELAALMNRAKELLGVNDTQALSQLAAAAATQPINERTKLMNVPEDQEMRLEDETNEEVLLHKHLTGAQGSLKKAYDALNDQYALGGTAGVTDAQQYLADARLFESLPEDHDDSASLRDLASVYKRSGDNSQMKGEEDDVSEQSVEMPHGCDPRLRPARLLTQAEFEEQLMTEERARKRMSIALWPLLLYLFFIAASGFYAYARVAYGMAGLSFQLTIYSYIVLVIELLGAINMLFYGVWLFAKPDNRDIFSKLDDKGLELPLRRDYIVRVLVPCYKESLGMIQRTVLAARRADRPPGTKVFIYICDDGGDPRKKMWVRRLRDPEVLYVSGRDKGGHKDLNGKSANLNHCLRLLYPDVQDPTDENEQLKIPVNELMCLFDADQTCSRGFFQVLLRYIDSGDNVGVALSPQLMYNVHPDCDIFNHQNVHFWEMMQPGMDALGFISLTGTNMIMRSRALHGAGWFPTNSVTEDWALGMRFKKLGYVCRYVNQYLAIGEAPTITQQAFQQRSRWSKGHFQVFWSRECPLFDRRLSLFFKLAYSSTCIAYLSTGLSAVIITLVPVLTILFGYFPIALNWWTVIAITAYYVGLNVLSYACFSWNHYKALWFANISSMMLFYPYLKASILTPIKQMLGLTAQFKTTLKGGAKGVRAGLKVCIPAAIIVFINVATIIIGAITFEAQVNAPQAISMCWIVFNTVPHLALILHAIFGPGGFMVAFCRVGMFITAASGALALVLMWLLWPKEASFVAPLRASVAYVAAEWAGDTNKNLGYYPDWRGQTAPFKDASIRSPKGGIVNPYKKNQKLDPFRPVSADLSMGFYEDGVVGPVKLTKSIALTTTMLAWTLLDAPDAFDEVTRGNMMELVAHGWRHVYNCYVKDPSGSKKPTGDVYVYSVGDALTESQMWRTPYDIADNPKPVPPIQVTAGIAQPADLTGQMVAALISGIMYLGVDALGLNGQQQQAVGNMINDLYWVTMNTMGVVEHPRSLWTSDSFYDDRAWAASWMYRAAINGIIDAGNTTAASIYFQDIRTSRDKCMAEQDIYAVSEDYIINAALVHAALQTDTAEFHNEAASFIWDWICAADIQYTPFGRAFVPQSPTLGNTVIAAALAQLYAVRAPTSGTEAALNDDFKRGFQCFAQQQARYLIGVGWRKKAYVTGLTADGYSHLVHHGASCPPEGETCPLDMPGSAVPDYNSLIGGLIWAPEPLDEPDDTRGGNTTAVSLTNNLALPLLMASIAYRDNSWLECLQDTGTLLKKPACRHARPVPTSMVGQNWREVQWGRVFDDNVKLPDGVNSSLPIEASPSPQDAGGVGGLLSGSGGGGSSASTGGLSGSLSGGSGGSSLSGSSSSSSRVGSGGGGGGGGGGGSGRGRRMV